MLSDRLIRGGNLKEYHRAISIFQRLADVALILLVGCFMLSTTEFEISIRHFVGMLITVGIYLAVSNYTNLYRSWRSQGIPFEIKHLLNTWTITATTLVIALIFLDAISKPEQTVVLDSEKLIIVSWLIISLMLLIVFRLWLRFTLRYFRAAGFNSRRIAIAGAGDQAVRFAQLVSRRPWMGIDVAAFFDNELSVGVVPDRRLDISVDGGLSALVERASKGEFDEVYIAIPLKNEEQINFLLEELSNIAVSVNVVPSLFAFDLFNLKIKDAGGLPAISVQGMPQGIVERIVKRVEDIVVSLAILSVAIWPMIAISLLIKVSSSGPVLFKQRRYGRSGEEFTIWKFRTMTVAENGDAVNQATRNDPRVTRIGAFLRKTSLDELPQFFNVLSGQMSIVGPRPHAVAHNELYRKDIPGYMRRHLIKPGITGLAQVNGWRGETDTLDKMERRVECDLEYLQNWSIVLDLKIIFLTLIYGFNHKNAY